MATESPLEATLAPNEICPSSGPPGKATLVQDLVRCVPVTKIISSILLIPSPSCRAQTNQVSMCLIIHSPNSPCAIVFLHLAWIGRDNTAPCFPLHQNASSEGLSGLRKSQKKLIGREEPQIPSGQYPRWGLRSDSSRTKVIGTQRARTNMRPHVECKLLVVLWNAKVFVGRIIRG